MIAMSDRSKAITVIAASAALLLVVTWRLHGPTIAPANAPAGEFSGTRAMGYLRRLIVDTPHPVGSAAHDVVRDRIVAQFDALGYVTRVQRTFACDSHNICANVENIIAHQPGQPNVDSDMVVVSAHYDSVPAGPGASDDGTGVASLLEIARAVRADHFQNRVTFLIDDGEEMGLLGAEGYVTDPNAKRAAFMINLEARGTTGPSFLFETSRHNRWMLPAIAGSMPRPITSSFFATIYDLLPNDTDLTVFKREGRAGINLAYLGRPTQYHTPLDNIAHADPVVVQQRGDQVLALLRRFANEDLRGREAGGGDAVWFDVLTFFIVWWPASWTLSIAIVLLAVTIVAAWLRMREEATNSRAISLGVLSFFISVFVAGALGFALSRILRMGNGGARWVAYPAASIAAMWLTGIGVAVVVAALFLRRARFDGLLLGNAIAWNVIAIVVAAMLPGASYLAIVPGATLAIGALLRSFTDEGETGAALLGALAAGTVMFALALVGYDSLGALSLPLIATFLAMVTTTASPLLARVARPLAAIAFAGAVVCLIVALALPTYTKESPRRITIAHQTDGKTTRWIADSVTPAMRKAAQFETTPRVLDPWYRFQWPQFVASAPAIGSVPIEARVIGDVRKLKRVLTVDLVSQRHAQRVDLVWHTRATVDSIRINGVVPPPRSARYREDLAPQWHRVLVHGSSARIEIVMREVAPIEAIASDTTFGLPPEGAALAEARDGSMTVTSGEGDVTLTTQTMQW
jgi:hypothetical protein